MVSIPPGSSLGRYRVVEQLGRGGMATVFRCHDPNLDRYVAVKVLPSMSQEDPSFVGRFAQEAQTVARLNHPNILQIYDFGDDKGYSFIVTELLPGGDLQDKLKGGVSLSPKEVVDLMSPLADALDFAHAQGIVHRDLKPANVFLDADHRPDLYAFGVMLYQMLLGQTPFRADTPAATLMAHVHQPLPLPTALNPDIEPRLEAALLKALAKDPEDRYQSAREMMRSIATATGQSTDAISDEEFAPTAVLDTGDADATRVMDAPTAAMEAGVAAPEGEVAAAPKRPLALIGGGVGAVVLVVVAAAFFVFSGGDPEAEPAPAAKAAPTANGETSQTKEPAPAAAVAPVAEPTATAEPEPSPTPVPIAELIKRWQEVQGKAEKTVVTLRDVTLEGAITTELKGKDELASITKGFFRRDYLRQQIFEAEQLYKALGMMSEDEDLEQILLDIQLQQVFALFDDESEKVYVVSDAPQIGPREELGYAAAYMGGIQQQLFDIASLRARAREGSSDEIRALDALIKGEVGQVASGYIGTAMSRDQVDVLREPIPESKLLAAPKVIQKANRFPSQEGSNFVNQLYGRDAWEGVARAYKFPPVSTEQIIHPEKYFDQEEPQRATMKDISEKIGKGWVQVSSNTMGEFLLRTYLEEHLSQAQATDAAAGWGGDVYSLLSGPEAERLVILQVKFDSFNDSAEFFDAYKAFVAVKTQGAAVPETISQTATKWVTPDEAVFLGQIGPAILLIIGDKEEFVQKALESVAELLQSSTP